MAFTRLLDGWNRSRRERTRMPWGRRVASMEAALGADMTPGRQARWERLELVDDQPEQDAEHQVDEHQVDEHQADEHQADEHETEHEEEPVAGGDEHSETGGRERAPHPGARAREFEEQLLSGTFGGAGLAYEQVGDAAQEVDHQQRDQPWSETEQPETEQPETEPESEPELEDDEVEP